MRRLAFLLVFLFSLPAFSQAKRPFAFEDLMKLKRVGEPVVSPDGKWVIFSVVDVDLEANEDAAHLDRAALHRGSQLRKKWGAPRLAKFARRGNCRARANPRSGWRPPALGAGWETLRVSLDQRGRLAGLGRPI